MRNNTRWYGIKKIAEILKLSWFLGGGLVISLGSLIFGWKIALAIFCVWMLSCIIAILVAIGRS